MIDQVHTSYNKSVSDAYHKLPQGCWEDMIDCETNFVVDLNNPQTALTVDTQSMMKFRLGHMANKSPMPQQLQREMRYVRDALRKHLKHLNDPTIHQKLSDGKATNPTEFFFRLGFTGMGILKHAEDLLWTSLGQNLKLVTKHYQTLTDQWKEVEEVKVGFADTLRKVYKHAVQLVHVNNALFKLSENWTVKPTSGWPFERKEIGCAEIVNECFDKTESICSEYPHAVHEAYTAIRMWFLKAFEEMDAVSGTDKQVREAALLTILFGKANKFQSEKQYNTMTVPGSSLDSAPDDSATSLDEDATVSSLGNESASHSSIPKKRTTRNTGTNKIKPKKAKTHHSDKWKQLIPDDKGEQQDIRSMSPSKWPHLFVS